MQIFLSYRRGDVGGYAGRLSDALVQRLGAKSVFQDVTAIGPGQDFTTAIDRALDDCDAVLAVIGPAWLTASTAQGATRLFEPDDYVRLELGRALRRDVAVIPVLVGGAGLPAADDLPAELRELARRQAVVLHDETWHRDVDGLVRSLRGEPALPHRPRRRWLLTGAGAMALLVVVVALLAWRSDGGGGDAGSQADLASCAPPRAAGWEPITLGRDPTGEDKLPNGVLRFAVTGAYARALAGTWEVTLATSMDNATPEAVYHGDWRYSSLVVGRREFKATCFSPNPNLVSAGTVGDALVGFEVRCQPVGYIELVLEGDRISVTDDTLDPGPC